MRQVTAGEILEVKTGKYDANHASDTGAYKFFTCALKPFQAETFAFDDEVIILPGNGANVGEVLYYKGKLEAYQRTYVLHKIKEHPRYLYYYFKKYWIRQITKRQVGSATNYIKMDDIMSFRIPVPPLPEQQKIAAILDAADQLRQKDQQLIEHYTRLGQSLFLEMFGDPVGNPMGWESEKLGNTCEFIGGGTPSRKNLDFYRGAIPWVTSKDMKGTFLYDAKEHVTLEAIANSSTKLVPTNSLLIVVKSKILMHTLPVLLTKVDSCFNQDIKAINPDSSVNIYFLFLYLKNMQSVILRKARGVNTEGLTLAHLKSIDIPLPPIELQNQFAQHIEAIEQQKQQAQASLEKSEALFNSLLQRAFKGELTG